MASSQQGVCTNFGNCSRADNRESISILIGSDFICPECERALSPNKKDGVKWDWRKIIIPIALILTLGGIAISLNNSPNAKIEGINNLNIKGRDINVVVSGDDKRGLKEMRFEIVDPQNKSHKEKWDESGNKEAKRELKLKTDNWEIGKYQYRFIAINTKGKPYEITGDFEIVPPDTEAKTPTPSITPVDEPRKPLTPDNNGSSNTGNLSGSKPQIPLEAKLNFQQGMTYSERKDYKNAIKEFTLAIEKYPDFAKAYSNRAVAHMQQRRYNRASDDLQRAIQIKPNDPDIYYNLTAFYSIQGQLDRALDSLDKSLEYGFKDYNVLRNDHDLANVRRDPEYKNILEKHKIFINK